ncbi:MAG: hypothetical protein JKY51_07865 [Opitutaceae bacterium]|nr:hypothetical protein [Opitutaceae bacterium]
MEDQTSKNEENQDLNSIDLTALEDFNFGTQWTKIEGGQRRSNSDRRPAGSRRSTGSGKTIDRRPDNRSGPSRRDSGERRYSSEKRGGGNSPDRRRQNGRSQGERRQHSERRPRQDNRPYVSPVFDVAFYPEDSGFAAIVKAMRTSCHTFELFDIVRLILEKPERSIVVFKKKSGEGDSQLYISTLDGAPFVTREEALNHVIVNHVEHFFQVEEVEVEAPQGNFSFVSRCSFTKVLLGPSSFHRYSKIIQEHYNTHLSERMSFDKFKASIEVVNDPEVVAEWSEQMKKTTRYSVKKVAEGEDAKSFDTLEEARTYLSLTEGDRIVRKVESARVPAVKIEQFKDTEACRAMFGCLEAQRRFPLDTANSLRGRLRREHFHVFKRGSKGITFVCSVKRKFRVVGEVFAETIDKLICFIETNPFVEVAALSEKHLGFSSTAKPAGKAEVDAESQLSPEQAETLKKMVMDLRWLITEGYVTEFANGTLFAPPALTHPPQGHVSVKKDKGHAKVEAAEKSKASVEAPAEKVAVFSDEKKQGAPVVVDTPSVDKEVETAEAPEGTAVSEAPPEVPTPDPEVEEAVPVETESTATEASTETSTEPEKKD